MQLSNNNAGQPSQDQASHYQRQASLDRERIKAENERFLKLCYEVFEAFPQGKELLDMLKESLLVKSSCSYSINPQTGMFEFDANMGFFRDGQNHLIRSLYKNINDYKEIIKQNALETQKANEGK